MDTSRVEKRNRPPLSCEPCRSRKLKCNRELPCDTCIRRSKQSICSYAANASRTRPGTNKVRNLKDRLDNVEQLVLSFLSSNEVAETSRTGMELSTDDTETATSSTDGYISISKQSPQTPHLHETSDGQVNYIDSSHWLSVLDDIREVREHFGSNHSTPPAAAIERSSLVSDFISSSAPMSSLDEILTKLPSRSVCDMLLSWYFNSRFMVLGIVHPAKFQTEYTSFWNSPSATSPLWIALLFSILNITVILRQVSNAPQSDSTPSIKILQESTVQCLVLGRYTTANEHALEAFFLHLQGGFFSGGSPTDLWFEMGTIIRLAFRMGYHRDPSRLKGISPFHAEMRRRVWMNIFQVDALMCFQLGFPSMVPTDFCDSETPRNLEYSDLQVDMVTLPPSRPLSEQTHILYGIVKAGVMSVFKKIVTHTQSLTVQSYDKTVALDAEMNRVYSAIPDSFRPRDVGMSFLDHSSLVWQRSTIEVLHLKGLIVLHRRYVNEDFESQQFAFSRRACIDAALSILSRQSDLHDACQPGGRLYEDRWMSAAIPVHDFLLAAMVVCLDLSFRTRSRGHPREEKSEFQQIASREYRALRTSRHIWAAKSDMIPEARIATSALDLMISKVDMANLGSLQHDDASDVIDLNTDYELPYAMNMSQIMNGSETIDWSMWDLYLQGMDPSMFDTVV